MPGISALGGLSEQESNGAAGWLLNGRPHGNYFRAVRASCHEHNLCPGARTHIEARRRLPGQPRLQVAASREMAVRGANTPETSVPTLSSDNTSVPYGQCRKAATGDERQDLPVEGRFRASRRSGLCFPWRASDEGLRFCGDDPVWVVRKTVFRRL